MSSISAEARKSQAFFGLWSMSVNPLVTRKESPSCFSLSNARIQSIHLYARKLDHLAHLSISSQAGYRNPKEIARVLCRQIPRAIPPSYESARPALISMLSFVIIAGSVPRPPTAFASKPGTKSSTVGTFGTPSHCGAVVTARAPPDIHILMPTKSSSRPSAFAPAVGAVGFFDTSP
jgi:hypothetical protein